MKCDQAMWVSFSPLARLMTSVVEVWGLLTTMLRMASGRPAESSWVETVLASAALTCAASPAIPWRGMYQTSWKTRCSKSNLQGPVRGLYLDPSSLPGRSRTLRRGFPILGKARRRT